MSEKEFIEATKELGIDLTEEQVEKFRVYAEFLLEYNSHTNLTAIKTMDDVYLKHFYDSLMLVKYFEIDNQTVLDIGSGAGFPGVPLKICFPEIELTTLDANNKKTKFLEELKNRLNIEYTVINERAEKYILSKRELFDLVIDRAVTAMPILAEISMPYVKVGGYFIPYKGKLDANIEDGRYAIMELGGEIERVIETSLPKENSCRTFVVVKKKCKTAEQYPRVFDKISKKPLQKRQ